MTMMKDLDEYTTEQLEAQLAARKAAVAQGVCDYCGRAGDTNVCRFPARHAAALAAIPAMGRMVSDIIKSLDPGRRTAEAKVWVAKSPKATTITMRVGNKSATLDIGKMASSSFCSEMLDEWVEAALAAADKAVDDERKIRLQVQAIADQVWQGLLSQNEAAELLYKLARGE